MIANAGVGAVPEPIYEGTSAVEARLVRNLRVGGLRLTISGLLYQ